MLDVAERPATRKWLALPASVAVLAVLFAPALLNGYPILFWDSGTYLSLRLEGLLFPIYYQLFAVIIGLSGTLWSLIAVQSLIAGSVLVMCLRAALAGDAGRAVPFALATAALTQLPWLTSWVMPDLFCGLGFLAILALALFPERLGTGERIFLMVITVVAALFSTANIAILAATSLAAMAARYVLLRQRDRAPALVWLACLLLVIAGALGPNLIAHGRPSVSLAGGALAFSRMVDARVMQPYLHANCPDIDPEICAILPELDAITGTRQAFLWDGLAERLDAWHDPDGRFSRLANAAALSAWPEILRLATGSILQLAIRPALDDLEIGPGVNFTDPGSAAHQPIAIRYPGDMSAFLAARQQAGALQSIFPAPLYAAVTFLSYAALLVATVISLARRDRVAIALCITTIAFVVAGLVVQGGLVGPYARYHVKLGWVVVPILLILATRRWPQHREARP